MRVSFYKYSCSVCHFPVIKMKQPMDPKDGGKLLALKVKPYFENHYMELPGYDIKDVHSLLCSLMYDNTRYWGLVDCPSRVIVKWVAIDGVRDAHIVLYIQENISHILKCNRLAWQPFDYFFDGVSQVLYKNTHFANDV